MSRTVWTPELGWHDGPDVDNADVVAAFIVRDATAVLRDAAYSRGWNDGTWGEYRGQGETNREQYDSGHKDGAEYRAGKMGR